ncbi:DUF397 domain-containing protein [Streptomyces sp. NPDC002553]|uniref:DUF397 domain-containing protein n=1 Tax=Streptomyces sp. NPDC002553 TaxID=3154417 RepID=UPI00332CF7BE
MPLPMTGWRKSSHSGDSEDACVEARAHPDRDGVLLRDSKDRGRPALRFSATAWHAFLRGRLG